jgi:hypothetical protein
MPLSIIGIDAKCLNGKKENKGVIWNIQSLYVG